jgi:hypothetical protein
MVAAAGNAMLGKKTCVAVVPKLIGDKHVGHILICCNTFIEKATFPSCLIALLDF